MDKSTRRGFLGRLAGIVAARVMVKELPPSTAISNHTVANYPNGLRGITDNGMYPDTIWMNSRQAEQYISFINPRANRKIVGIRDNVLTEDMLIKAFDDIKRRR